MNKKLISMLLAVILILSSTTTVMAADDAAKAEYTWDLTQIYKTQESWQADYDIAYNGLNKYESFKGKLSNPDKLKEYMDELYKDLEIINRLYAYADLKVSLNVIDDKATAMLNKANELFAHITEATAFSDEEILKIPLAQRKALVENKKLAQYEYSLRSFINENTTVIGEEAQSVLAKMQQSLSVPYNVYNILTNADLVFEPVKDENGKSIVVSEGMYALYRSNPNRELRQNFVKNLYEGYAKENNTFAALLGSHIRNNIALAEINGYENPLEMAVSKDEVSVDVYNQLIDVANNNLELLHRFIKLKSDAMGIDAMGFGDISYPSGNYVPGTVAYDDSKDMIKQSLSILGEDYGKKLDTMLNDRRIDVYETPNKASGAFSSAGAGLTYILLNYGGTYYDVSTLAHELGHSVYSMYSSENQPSNYKHPKIFTEEVASTANEALMNNYYKSNAKNDDEKLFYIEKELDNFVSTFFMQTMYAEFEKNIYDVYMNEGTISADRLNQMWYDTVIKYFGESFGSYDYNKYGWARIPHFYLDFYVYKYATSFACSTAIVQKIYSGEKNAVDNYIKFLKAGGSSDPESLLAIAGVSPTDAKTYENAFDYMESLLDEYEALQK